MVGARVLENNLELADGVYRLAARSLPQDVDAEVTMLRWRDECWGVVIEDYPKIPYKKNLKMNFWVFF